jgi:hypothetical protein
LSVDKLRLTLDLDLPADLFERSKFISACGEPIGVMRAALEAITGGEVPIRHEVIGAEPEVKKRAPRGTGKRSRKLGTTLATLAAD